MTPQPTPTPTPPAVWGLLTEIGDWRWGMFVPSEEYARCAISMSFPTDRPVQLVPAGSEVAKVVAVLKKVQDDCEAQARKYEAQGNEVAWLSYSGGVAGIARALMEIEKPTPTGDRP